MQDLKDAESVVIDAGHGLRQLSLNPPGRAREAGHGCSQSLTSTIRCPGRPALDISGRLEDAGGLGPPETPTPQRTPPLLLYIFRSISADAGGLQAYPNHQIAL
jgi:hypothetical protein